jgi:colanic acid biosynthesis glycosyl transferase WcaI
MSLYNRRMRVLLLNLYFPPDTSATARVAEELAEVLAAKHEVTVLCGRPSYDPTERRAWKLWRTERWSNGKLVVIRVGSTDYARMQMKRRVLNYLSYVALAVPRALAVRCDVVVAMTDPPFAGILGAFIAGLKGKPYVYNIQDMYPDMAVGGAIMRPGMPARMWEKLHRWALRRAARIVVLGEDMRTRIISKGVDPGRVTIVRAGAELPSPDDAAPALDADVIRSIRGDFRFVLLHAGNLGFYGAWDTLIAAARELANGGIGFVFVGNGAERERVISAASGCSNVRFLPFFPADKVSSVLAAPDAHIITVKRGLEGVVVPSKMYGILAAGKPIVTVAAKETDAALLGTRQGFALCADPDQVSELVAAVRSLSGDARRLRSMGQAALAAAASYDKRVELRKFLQVVNEVQEGAS